MKSLLVYVAFISGELISIFFIVIVFHLMDFLSFIWAGAKRKTKHCLLKFYTDFKGPLCVVLQICL